jgi:hypothetical protein
LADYLFGFAVDTVDCFEHVIAFRDAWGGITFECASLHRFGVCIGWDCAYLPGNPN